MATISAFGGWRYDLGHVGSLSDVIAPPYDVIDKPLQDELYKRHPANIVRLILNRDEPGDEDNSRYTRAARFLRNWRGEGVLRQESSAAIYVYHQIFSFAGRKYTRRGFMCRLRLERFGEGRVYPHEETHSAAKADRLKLTTACRANLSQIFGLYPDSENAVQELLEAAIAGVAPLEATDHLGAVHRMWPLTDVKTIAEVTAAMAPKSVYIADGHHRYETACNYRDQLAAGGRLDAIHPANFVLMMCVGMSDPGMIVLPTHRLFRGLPAITSSELIEKIEPCFTIRTVGTGCEHAEPAWEEIETAGDQQMLGLFTQADQTWLLAKLNGAGCQKMVEVAQDRSQQWQGLGVSLLHRLLVENLLHYGDLPSPKYVHSVSEAIEGIQQGDSAGRDATGQCGRQGHFPLVALVMPATLEHVRSISQHGERMPAKSTYFYPKLLSGLVINPLE